MDERDAILGFAMAFLLAALLTPLAARFAVLRRRRRSPA